MSVAIRNCFIPGAFFNYLDPYRSESGLVREISITDDGEEVAITDGNGGEIIIEVAATHIGIDSIVFVTGREATLALRPNTALNA